MPDVPISADSVFSSIQAFIATGTAGELITQGQPVYLKESDRRLWKASSATAETANFAGIALAEASAGQPLQVVVSDPNFQYGGDTEPGSTLYISSTTGAITTTMPTTGQYVTLLGVTFDYPGTTFDSTVVTWDSTLANWDSIPSSNMNLNPIENGPYNP